MLGVRSHALRILHRSVLSRSALVQQHVRQPLVARTFASSSRRCAEAPTATPGLPVPPVAEPVAAQAAAEPAATTIAAASTPPPVDDIAGESIDVASAITQFAQPFELGHIREVGLGSFFTPVGWAQNIIEATGALTGLPAWATLAVVTITGRMLILPLLINTQKEAVKLQLVQPKITAVQQQMAAERAEGSITAMSSQQHMVEIQKIYASVGYKMSRAMGGAVSQLLFSASFFLGVRAMANVPIEQLTYGSGALWFQDLSAVDPYYILPALATISFVGMMRMAATDAPPNERFPNLFNGMTLFTGMSFLFLANLPAALCFQMACNGVFGLFQSSLLRIPSFRKLVGLAPRVVYTPRSMRESLTDWRGGWGRLQEANRLAQEGEAQKRRKNRF